MDALKWLWQYVKRYKLLLVCSVLLTTVHMAAVFINPVVTGYLVDNVIQGGQYDLLFPYVVVIIVAVLLKEGCWYVRQLVYEHISQNIVLNLRCTLFRRLQILDFKFFDRNRTGDIMSRMTADTEAIRQVIAGTIPNMFDQFCFITFGLVTMFSISPALAGILLTISPFVAFLAIKMSKMIKKSFIDIREITAKLNSAVQENISGNRVVKAYTREDFEIEKFENVNNGYRDAYMNFVHIWVKYAPKIEFFVGMTYVIFLLFGGILVIRGYVTIGQFATINGVLWCIVTPLQMLGNMLNEFQKFVASTIKIRMLSDTEPEIKNHEILSDSPKFEGNITFKNVVFSYDEERVLKYINFTAKRGDTVAIIGPTGCGKSTLINLISRFYDPDMGSIYIDGINIKNLDITTIRKNVSVAMQDIFLFSDTIEGNIAYGVPAATLDDVIRVAKAADAHDFIVKMPEGYDTIVGERGVGLSGGQKQRIALARALLKDPAFLVLDDTTSAVDMETEFSIQETLKNNYSDKTTFIIAHRISSVKNADLILVLNKGKMIEWGTHDQLLAQKGYYYEVYQNQFGDFNQAPPYKDEYPDMDAFAFSRGGVR